MDVIGDRTMADLLSEQMESHGSRIGLIYESQAGEVNHLSFRQLGEAALGMAAGLQSLGLAKGDRAFVFLRNVVEYVPVWFGLMCAGGVMVPGNINLTESEVAYQLTHSAPRLIITEPRFLPLFMGLVAKLPDPPTIVLVGGEQAEGAILLSALSRDPAAYQPVALCSSDLAEILYTSGTTSRPKGVMLTHANLLWCGISVAAMDRIGPDDRFFNNKPLFHANCQSSVLGCFTAGATIVIGERYSATRYMSQLVQHEATICSLSGMLCRTLLNQPPSANDTMHRIRFARYAINISQDEINAFTERFRIPLVNGYGLSEAMLMVTLQWVGSPSTYPSIGRPAMDREIYIADDDNLAVPTGEVGEIVVRGQPGRNLMLGYYRDEEATHAAFAGGWLHTGDLGWMDAKGNIYFFGRKKDVIKRAGENVSAAEVEEVLVGHPSVRDVAVIGVPDPVRDQAVKAFVVLHGGASDSEADLQEYCRTRLAYFKVPQYIAFIEEIPRNASGKILKRELQGR